MGIGDGRRLRQKWDPGLFQVKPNISRATMKPLSGCKHNPANGRGRPGSALGDKLAMTHRMLEWDAICC